MDKGPNNFFSISNNEILVQGGDCLPRSQRGHDRQYLSGMITVQQIQTIDDQQILPQSRQICRFAARKQASIPSGRAELHADRSQQ
jgi:hypothetical protein